MNTPPYRVSEVAEVARGRLIRGDPSAWVHRLAPTGSCDPESITFVTDLKYLPDLARAPARAVILSPDVLKRTDLQIPPDMAVIEAERPYLAFARVAQLFADPPPRPVGCHPMAVVDPAATLGSDVALGPFVYVGPRARVGDGAVLHAGVHVEADAEVGAASILYNHVVIRHGCKVGARCILHPGVVVGSDGFGFAPDEREDGQRAFVKIPQVGNVQVENETEIGANTCIDRAAFGTTRIGEGVKIDNLVQVAHNVTIGARSVLVAQSGVAGSSHLGSEVVVAAQAGIAGHVKLGDRSTVTAQSGVMREVKPGDTVAGSPATSKSENFRQIARIGKLDSLFRRVKKLERSVTERE